MAKAAVDMFTRCTALGTLMVHRTNSLTGVANVLFPMHRLGCQRRPRQCRQVRDAHTVIGFGLKNFLSPGVVVTEVHRRAGLSDEQYAAVSTTHLHACVRFFLFLSFLNTAKRLTL